MIGMIVVIISLIISVHIQQGKSQICGVLEFLVDSEESA